MLLEAGWFGVMGLCSSKVGVGLGLSAGLRVSVIFEGFLPFYCCYYH